MLIVRRVLGDPIGHRLEQLPTESGHVVDRDPERLLRQGEQLHRGGGDDRRLVVAVEEQAQLAHEIAGSELGDVAPVPTDDGMSGDDHVGLARWLSFGEHDLIGLELIDARRVRQVPQFALGAVREEWQPGEVVDLGVAGEPTRTRTSPLVGERWKRVRSGHEHIVCSRADGPDPRAQHGHCETLRSLNTVRCSKVKDMSSRPSRLTTSSYAVLGLLAIQPWTGYELAQQASRSLRFAWPKSERLLYAEPKKLVEHGLATSREERVGQRPRTLYTITDDGRAALAEWTTTAPQPPTLEAESLLRLLFAENGGVDDLVAALDAMADEAAEMYEQVATINTGYLDGEHPFPQRTHLSVLFATFQLELFDLMVRWVEFAKAEIAEWPTTEGLGMTERTEAILDDIQARRSVLPPRVTPEL